MLRVPISTVLGWQPADILAWKSAFAVLGPLDFVRDDRRDARAILYQFGSKGDTVSDHLIYRLPDVPKTESEQNIDELKETLEEMSVIPGADGIEEVRALIRKAEREAF